MQLGKLPNYEVLRDMFRQANIPLSDCQASTVKHCVANCLKVSKSLWRVGAGMGKSHLIAFATLLLLNLKPESTIYVVFSSRDLMNKDAGMIEAVKAISRAGKKVKLVLAKTRIAPKRNDFVLVDECDAIYFSHLDWFEKIMSDTTVVGFTATPPSKQEQFESEILKKFFGENIHDSLLSLKLRDGEDEPHANEPELIDIKSVPQLVVDQNTPAIIYCDPNQTT